MNTTQQNDDASPSSLSTLFCDANADITFISSDNVLFKIYNSCLAPTSMGFAVPEGLSIDEQPIQLQESSEILEILFQFIHPCPESMKYRQPSLMIMDPKVLFAVAEAAEKYVVFGAMNSFIIRMHQLVDEHPLDILQHCDRHGYPDLGDQAALKSLSCPLEEVAAKLTQPGLLAKWLVYRAHWQKLVDFMNENFKAYATYARQCLRLTNWQLSYLLQTVGDIHSAAVLPDVNTTLQCPWIGSKDCGCSRGFVWQPALKEKASSIPSFSALGSSI